MKLWTCGVCQEDFGELLIGAHLQSRHPEVGPVELWPDGGVVYLDAMVPEALAGRDEP